MFPCPALPPRQDPGVNAKFRSRPPRQPQRCAMPDQLFGQTLGFRQAIVAEEWDDRRHEPDVRCALVGLPVEDARRIDAYPLGRFSLKQLQAKASPPDVVPDGLRLSGNADHSAAREAKPEPAA